MNTWQRRAVAYVSVLTALVVAFSFLSRWGLETFEGEPIPLYRSVQFVIEAFTATGFGAESPWQTLDMNVIVAIIDIVSVFSVFLAIPVLLVPLFQATLSTNLGDAVEVDEAFGIAEFLVHRGSDLVGKTLAEADIRSRTGCTVVAVERDGRVQTDLGPAFRVQAGDELVVAGTDEGVNHSRELPG